MKFLWLTLALTLTAHASSQIQTLGFPSPGGNSQGQSGSQILTNAGTPDQGVKFKVSVWELQKNGKTLSGIDLLNALNETRVNVEYYKYTNDSELIPQIGATAKQGERFKAIHSFIKYIVVQAGEKAYAFGVKTSIEADYTVTAKQISLSGFLGLSGSRDESKVKGFISVTVSGICGPTITDYISMPAELNETTIQKALQDFAVIKSKLYDKSTVICPTIIGVLDTKLGEDPTQNKNTNRG